MGETREEEWGRHASGRQGESEWRRGKQKQRRGTHVEVVTVLVRGTVVLRGAFCQGELVAAG